MTDAELMTTDPDVPGLEVRPASWEVWVGHKMLGTAWSSICDSDRFQAVCVIESNIRTCFLPTRNEAVQWILDQHKGETK